MNGELKLLTELRDLHRDLRNDAIANALEAAVTAMSPTPAPGALPELPAIPESLMATLQDAMNQYAHTGGCDIDAVVAAIGAYAEQCRAGVEIREKWYMCRHPAYPDPYPCGESEAEAMATLKRFAKTARSDTFLLCEIYGPRRELHGAALQSAFADDEGEK